MKPAIEDYDVTNQVHKKLGCIVEEDRDNNPNFYSVTIAQRCLALVNKIEWEIKQTFKSLDPSYFEEQQNSSINGLFRLMNSWKTHL